MSPKKGLANRRENIVTAAHVLFGRYGYERTTLDDIAKEANIGKGSIYLEFDTKEAILMAVIAQCHEGELEAMRAIASAATPPILPHLETMLVEHLLSIYDNVKRQNHSPEEMAMTSLRVRQEFQPFFDQKEALIAVLLEKAAQSGEIRPQSNYRVLSQLLGKGLAGFFPPYIPTPTREQMEQDARQLLALMLTGLKQWRLGEEAG